MVDEPKVHDSAEWLLAFPLFHSFRPQHLGIGRAALVQTLLWDAPLDRRSLSLSGSLTKRTRYAIVIQQSALWGRLRCVAEGEGFEPPREREPPGGFQDRCLKPLGHPSKLVISIS